ncbi:tetratricopeptide repeat protein [Curvibacter sp. APW13]|uniref:tetratricopeptide repeat protein n=1 Tax=Curvibacter sp. APW13 TaxID=3077236 RepID=UPI0028DF3F44|nr:tetratricopeptide repeat protein [Curvibacter sp. APW13]MDT8992899.1 tetratricopeptide repeat protein [Curvibacter sp. APW13]
MALRQTRTDTTDSFAQALALQNAGDLLAARSAYEAVLAREPDHPHALNNLGVLLNAQGAHADALTRFDAQLALAPDNARAHANRGVALKNLGRQEEAVDAYRQALQHDPQFAAAHNNLGNLLYGTGQYAQACVHFDRACALEPNAVDYRFMLAKCLLELQLHARAQAELELIVRQQPAHADAWGTLARVWCERHCLPEAMACFEQGLKAKPDYAGLIYNRGLARLLAGDMAGGYADYERRFDVPDFPSKRIKTTKPLWDGSVQHGKTLLVHAEQGLGDTLQYLRHIALLPAYFERVLLLIQEPLTSLVELPKGVELLHEGSRPPPYDMVAPLLSIPHLLRLGDQIPGQVPYLHIAHDRIAAWAARITAPGLRVGLVWAGNPAHKNDANRSIALDALHPLLGLDGVQFYSFQVGARSTDLQALPANLQGKVLDLSDELKDFGETAAALQHMDLLVCVDTSICHVAGALGIPTWLLIPWMPDWRWRLEREDTPWYPSVRILRQPSYRDWDSVLERLTRELRELANPNSAAGKRRHAAAHALVEQGRVLLERNEPALAAPAFWQALRLCPTHARAASALAICAFRQGLTHAAVTFGQRACRLNPTDPESWSNCSAYFKAIGDLPSTMACFEQGLKAKPDYAGLIYNRGLARLLAGDMAGGYADYERRFDVPDFPSKRIKTTKPLWDGSVQHGKTLLVHAEQGLGDTLQYLRHIALLPAYFERVLLLIQEPLTSLVELPKGVELLHEGSRPPPYDMVAPLLSIPHLLRLGDQIPGQVPYLHIAHDRIAAWAARITAPGLRVGLVWAGNPAHKNDANRSIALDALHPLLGLDGVQFYSFQVGARSTDLQALPANLQGKVLDLSDELKDFGETAAALQHMDLLVCVDTSICHVAGALGIPTWLLIPWMPDWRWRLEREDTPWYPSVRILRQPSYRDWDSVLERLTRELRELANPNSAAGKRRHAAAHALVEQGRVLLERNEPALAAPAFWQALRLCPTHARAASALAICAFRQGLTHAAVTFGQRACRLNPTDPESWSNGGAFLKNIGRLDEALAALQTAVRLAPGNAQAWANLGNALGTQGRWAEALDASNRAVKLAGKDSEYRFNQGIALKENGRFEEALQTFRHLTAQPGGHVKAALHQALIELAMGDFAAGWTDYESRWLQPDAKEKRQFTQALWNGEPLEGKTILLHAEQGFGDSFQFVRYVPLLAARGARVVLVVQPDIHSLLSRVEGLAQMVASGAELPPFDYHCPLLSLPRAFGTTLETVPAQVPYLTPLPERVTYWKKQLGSTKKRRIALVWAGRPTHGNDANRSMQLADFAALLRWDGVECFSVQKGAAAEAQIASLPSDCRLNNLSPAIRDFEDTAAILSQMDELVTVDTSVAHLAGALGRRVRLLLPCVPDWRWLLERHDSPWYPRTTLYRQQTRAQWGDAVAHLLSDLQRA